MFKKIQFQINAVLLNFSMNPETYISQFLTQEKKKTYFKLYSYFIILLFCSVFDQINVL